jgi:hypothetical protein
MTHQEEHRAIDLRPLHDASRFLLGYFVHTWYTHYLSVIMTNLRSLHDNGFIVDLARPTALGRRALFDFGALNIEKLRYIVGIYFYILSSHKAANYRLMQRTERKQVMYLRGYDYEGSVSTGAGHAMGFSSWHTEAFGGKLRDLLQDDCTLVKVLSPKDVYWETVDAQRYFAGDYDRMIQLILQRPCSVYLNALSWQEGVADLLDRMDHYVVYVSSITASSLWELEQLDTEERRDRVTVVFDEAAISYKDKTLGLQAAMRLRYPDQMLWSKDDPLPDITAAELRSRLARTFVVTTPDDFEARIDEHRRRISEGCSRLPPGKRETWLDFRFFPAVDPAELAGLRRLSEELEELIDAAIIGGIECLPLFLDQVQVRIFTTLLLGEHDHTGRALAAYAGVMKSALDYYEPGDRIGALSAKNREGHLAMLREHLDIARYAGVRLLAYGRSHEFDDFSRPAEETYGRVFAAVSTAAAGFLADRGGRA